MSAQCPTEVALDNDIDLEELEKKVLAAFDDFWEAFPRGRKRSKAKAREAWVKACQKENPAAIIAAAKHYATTPEAKGKYVPMPSSWLNQERWDDDRAAWEGTEPDPEAEAKRRRESERRMAAEENAKRERERREKYQDMPSLAAEIAKRKQVSE